MQTAPGQVSQGHALKERINMNTIRPTRLWVQAFGAGLALLAAGCATVDPTAVASFSNSVTAVKTQTDDALNSVAGLTRDASINYAATQPTLAEANFVVTPTADTISEWDGALSTIETYSQNLSALLSPEAVQDFDVAATNLYNQFVQTADRLKSNSFQSQANVGALLATAFTEAGGAIMRAREEATAVKVAHATDTNIASICNLLAAELGADRNTIGLRRTVYETVWTPRLAALAEPFLRATNTTEKVALSQQYANLLAMRDAEDQILAGLRRSILLLSDAHHTLAQGKPASIQADLNVIAGEIQHTRELYSQFSSLNKK
jgi:hypothetical protein